MRINKAVLQMATCLAFEGQGGLPVRASAKGQNASSVEIDPLLLKRRFNAGKTISTTRPSIWPTRRGSDMAS
jgi:hypothetical protein